jgi:hypothetical protein
MTESKKLILIMLIKQLSANIKKISRLDSESIIKVAAYIKRGIVHDEREGLTYDFTHKADDLLHTGVYLPNNAPSRFCDEMILCNEANNAEKRYDTRTGRTLRCSLPNELTIDENIKIVNEVAQIFTSRGMYVFVAIHEGQNLDDSTKNNPHVHMILTDRPVDKNGFLPKKNREWNKNNVRELREQIEQIINRYCERNKLKIRYSCQSLEVQGIDRKPQINIGRDAMEMVKRGAPNRLGDELRGVIKSNEIQKEQEHQRELEIERDMDYWRSR